MRRTVAAATTAVLLAAAQTTSAHAAPAAPSDVKIGWSGTKLHLTWQDAGEANNIRVEYGDLTQLLELTAAGAANDILLPAAPVDQDKVRITVTARTADGESAATPTAWFDTHRPAYPFIQDAELLSDMSVRIAWTQAARGTDTTPDDPLDRPASDEWLRATIETPGRTEAVPLVPGTTQATLAPRPRPAVFLLSAGNEWGTAYEKATDPPKRWVKAGTMVAKTAVPAEGSFGESLRINSALDEYFCACAEHADSGIPVWLQARPTAAAAWQTVGRYSGETVDPFSTGITSVGGRQFRLWVRPARRPVRLPSP